MHDLALSFLSSLTFDVTLMQLLSEIVSKCLATIMQLVCWQGLIIIAEELQSDITLDQADSSVIRLDRTNNILMNLEIPYLTPISQVTIVTRSFND
jgi:hypothetical protein